VPNVRCPTCQLESYIAAAHTAQPTCPHCDAAIDEALPRERRIVATRESEPEPAG
jgi:hypothetical protein